MKKGGCWIFLSHSSKDIKIVRQIRNEFERHGHNPLAFHLLCLTTDTEEGRAELDLLIKREIDAREWFVFCASEYSNLSEYVKMERDYIIGKGNKKIWTLDLSKPFDRIMDDIRSICTQIKIFVSYARQSSREVKDIVERLAALDYDVWTDEDKLMSGDFSLQIDEVISDAVQYGFCVLYIDSAYTKSKYCMLELEKIISKSASIIPIVIGDVVVPEVLDPYKIYRLQEKPDEAAAARIAAFIEEETIRQIQES